MFLKRHKITKWSLLYQIVGTNSSVRIFAFLLVPNKVSSIFDHTLDVEKKVLKCQIRKWNVLCIIFWCQIVWVLKCPFLALDNQSGAKLSSYPMQCWWFWVCWRNCCSLSVFKIVHSPPTLSALPSQYL